MPDTPAARPNAVLTLDPQDGECISVGGGTYRILADGRHTDGAFAIIDMLIPPKGGAGSPCPRPH